MTVSAGATAVARCSCGRSWAVAPKPDGTLPARSRCALSAGGCGRSVRVSGGAAPAAPAAGRAAPAGAWEPPSAPRRPSPCREPCPHCGEPEVYADPRGTVRVCLACKRRVIPPGVLAPYERGTEVTRAARSQRERDDDAKQTAVMAGEFLRRVAALLADPRIHPRSADILRWYDEEVTEARRARDAGRLAELAGQFTADRGNGAFRRLHLWQGHPDVSGPGLDPDDEGTGEARGWYPDGPYYGDEDQDDEAAAPPPPAPRRPVVLATPATIARQQHRAQPRCQVAERGALCGAYTDRGFGGVWVCERHYRVLAAGIAGAWRRSQGRPA